jgi:molybdopterin converting factor subunit 1
MRVRVLYFGVLRERMGRSDEAIELKEEATAGDLLRILRGRASNGSMALVASTEAGGDADERLWRSLAVAVNREYVAADIVLRDGDEVALLPPVSGGSFGATRTGPSRTAEGGSPLARTAQGRAR